MFKTEISNGQEIITGKKQNLWKRCQRAFLRDKFLWLLIAPGICFIILFCYIPMYGVLIAFQNFSPYKGMAASPWIGFAHFQDFFGSSDFWRLIKNTVLISVYSLIFGFPVPIILAIVLNEIRTKWFKKVVQTVSYLPYFISIVVVCGMIKDFLQPSTGIINHVIKALGGEPIYFLLQPQYFKAIYVISGIWQSMGWNSIIYLAAIAGIDPGLYEAAIIDGANSFKRVWHITLPGLLPTISILLIMNLGSILSVGYEKIILLYNDNTLATADVISTYVYRRGLVQAEYSFGAAVGLFQNVINFLLIVIANYTVRHLTETSLW